MGCGKNSHIVHVIDYGLSKRYRDPKTGKHIPYREGKSLTGTARYASINTHKGREQSRGDDMESFGYILVYLFKGSLPWQGMPAPSKKNKYELIMQKKIETSLETLCSGMPSEFERYLDYCRKLKFEDKPDYHYLKRLFKELFIREGYEYDNVYDWVLIPWSQKAKNAADATKVIVDLEFSAHDEVVNYNLCNPQESIPKLPSPKNGILKNMPNQQGEKANYPHVDGDSSGGDKFPDIKKKADPEHLRTELKSVENRKVSSNNLVAISKSLDAPKIKPLPPPNPKEKKQGKDCNMF